MKVKMMILVSFLLVSANLMAAQTENGSYKLDKDHAHIGFQVSHLGFSLVVGRFNKFDGKVSFEAGGNSNVEFTIQAASIDTNNKRRDNHLRNEDFFDVETFSEITFKSTKVTYDESGDPAAITGDLNMHGVTQSVVFTIKAIGAGAFRGTSKAGYQAKTTITRTDFDMSGFAGVIGNTVDVVVNLEIDKE